MRIALLCLVLSFTSFATAAELNRGTSGGRFQVMQLSDARRDQILIDTQTGKTWHMNCVVSASSGNDCEYSAWMADDVEGITKPKAQIYKEANELRAYMKREKDAEDARKAATPPGYNPK